MVPIDPVALDLGGIKIHWYGILYLLSFVAGYLILLSRRMTTTPSWTKEQVGDLIFFSAIGVILGGRIGYILFYNYQALWTDPFTLLAFWLPGRSFHGGAIGVLICLWIFSLKYHLRFLQVTDFFAPVVPIGIAGGRLGNFINGELWGRASDVPWAMVFPHMDGQPRHPSSLYELLLEGVLLYLVLDFTRRKTSGVGIVSGVFLLGYGVLRFAAEFFREPDVGIGFVYSSITMGQLLSIPMVIIGLAIVIWGNIKVRGTK